MIPSRKECLRLLGKYGVPVNIKRHSLQVAKVSMYLGRKISKRQKVDLRLLEAASLLHDIDKHHCFNDSSFHGKISEGIFRKEGCPELIPLVQTHVLSSVLREGPRTLEAKILYCADQRVKHDRVVTSAERKDYIRKKYGAKGPHVMRDLLKAEPKALKIEKEILRKAGVSESLPGLRRGL
jgi:putative nucleotidyltransferase with HDIG domain